MSVFDVPVNEIYLDNAATTRMDPMVVEAMIPYLEERYGNAGTAYRLGREARDAVENARAKVAALLGVSPDRVFFTSGGTEANNWAVKGFSYPYERRVVVAGAVEHKSVLAPANWAANRGIVALVVTAVDGEGVTRPDALEAHLKQENVGLVCIQHSNNEVGTIQPVEDIARLCRMYGAVFHCDAVQSFGKVPVDPKGIGIDMMSVSAHKIHGPKGIGALYVREGVEMEPLLHGGPQEGEMRAGTVPVALAVGFGKAAELAAVRMESDSARMTAMTRSMGMEIAQKMGAIVNGSLDRRLPHILSITIPGIDASMVAAVVAEKHNVIISTGAACATRQRGSTVLEAMGRSGSDAYSTLRISIGSGTIVRDVAIAISRIQNAIAVASKSEVL